MYPLTNNDGYIMEIIICFGFFCLSGYIKKSLHKPIKIADFCEVKE